MKKDFLKALVDLEEQNKFTPENINEILKNINNYSVDKSTLDSPVLRKQTGLQVAIKYNFPELAKFFVENGADTMLPDGQLVHSSIKSSDDTRYLKCLLENKKTKVNIANDGGETPLHIAAKLGAIETCGLLIENGADLNMKDIDGNIPLHLLAKNLSCDEDSLEALDEKKLNVAKLMIEKTNNINQTDSFGETVLHIIARKTDKTKRNNMFLADFFIKNGVDPNLTNKWGKRASEVTKKIDLVQYLQKKENAPGKRKTDEISFEIEKSKEENKEKNKKRKIVVPKKTQKKTNEMNFWSENEDEKKKDGDKGEDKDGDINMNKNTFKTNK